jgi:hypothetical protein
MEWLLVYRGGGNGSAEESQLTWYGRDGKVLGTAGDCSAYQTMLLSPDQARARRRAEQRRMGR